jgi:hypothetical protein
MQFTSYANEWDLHKGAVSISELPAEKQEVIIRQTFDPHDDVRDYCLKLDVRKSQIEGFRAVVICVGMTLEQLGMADMGNMTANDIQLIRNFLDGTNLGKRIEHTFVGRTSPPPDYNWAELEGVSIGKLTECSDEAPSKVKAHLLKYIKGEIIFLFLLVFNHSKYTFRVTDRKVAPYRMRYYACATRELQTVLGFDFYQAFLATQATDIQFLKTFYLFLDGGFHSSIPPEKLVPFVISAFLVYTTESKPKGMLQLLHSINKLKTSKRR